MARLSGIQISALAQVRDKLASGRTGPGLGEWTDILQEVQGRRFRTLSDTSPFGDLRGLFGDEEAKGARTRLTDRRNDESHQRRVELRDLPEAVQSTKKDVGLLLSRSLLLADFPLIYVRKASWDEYRRTALVTYNEMMGDHEIVPSKTMEVADRPLEEGSLYLVDGLCPHLFRPLIIGATCTTCGHWSTFVPDRVRNGTPVYRSLEHGHLRDEPEFAASLATVGLLP